MKFLQSIAGTECAVLLAMVATTFLMSGQGMSFDAVQLVLGNF